MQYRFAHAGYSPVPGENLAFQTVSPFVLLLVHNCEQKGTFVSKRGVRLRTYCTQPKAGTGVGVRQFVNWKADDSSTESKEDSTAEIPRAVIVFCAEIGWCARWLLRNRC